MSKMQVWRLNGQVINIGPWDEQPVVVDQNPIPDDLTNSEEPLEDGSYDIVYRHHETREIVCIGPWPHDPVPVATNPLPEGAVSRDEEVVEGPDGGLYVAGDPRLEA